MVAGLALAAGKMQFPKLWVLTASPLAILSLFLLVTLNRHYGVLSRGKCRWDNLEKVNSGIVGKKT
jgi:hypothetical protein